MLAAKYEEEMQMKNIKKKKILRAINKFTFKTCLWF